jgi:hypothetical protein
LNSESASDSRLGNELTGNPLRWVVSAGEDKLGFSRQEPSGSSDEDPTVRVKPRTEGESVSHERASHLNGDSEARCNHESGMTQPVTELGHPGRFAVLESPDR